MKKVIEIFGLVNKNAINGGICFKTKKNFKGLRSSILYSKANWFFRREIYEESGSVTMMSSTYKSK